MKGVSESNVTSVQVNQVVEKGGDQHGFFRINNDMECDSINPTDLNHVKKKTKPVTKIVF